MPLNRADLDFMLRTLPLRATLRRQVEDLRQLALPLSPETKAELRDLVGERLIVEGFDRSGEPNPLGRRLEDLIDAIGFE